MVNLLIKNISKTYPNGIQALKNVNLEIKNGMFGLLGPNGAGKSTLMRTIATLQESDSGEITFDGFNIHKEPEEIRRQLGYLPQEFGVYPKISAFDLLNHLAILKGILNRRERTDQVNALLQQTNLYKVRKKAVGSFSGGMRQRFGIAQALLGDPKLIILDEPTAGLDPMERSRFLNLLSEIAENVVVILSTHIVEDVLDLCPQMAIMAEGKVILRGRPTQLIDELKGRLWFKTVSKADLADYNRDFEVISTRLFAGDTQIHVLSNINPKDGFTPLNPELEDVYFTSLLEAKKKK
jgi:ABC-type multidrug transport system ATPase subunit